MKHLKMILAVLAIVLVSGTCYADSPTSEDLENYKSSLMAYVRMQGYTPKLDSDGDIQFKHDGDTYWVQAVPYDDGYYVTVMTSTSIDGYNINNIRQAMDDAVRSLKYVRMYTSSSRKSIVTEYNWYCVSVNDFKRMFENALSVVTTCENRFVKNFIALED